MKSTARRDGRVAEGARLESVYTFTGIGGSNPSLSAIFHSKGLKASKSAATVSATLSLILPARSVLARSEAFTDETHQGQPVREHGTRRYKPAKRNTSYPADTTYVLRYSSTWETLTVDNLSDATAKRIERELELLRGWRPIAKPKPETISVKMLDAAIDAYLHEVEATRKPKTHSAYKTSPGYFFESTGNKPLRSHRLRILCFRNSTNAR
jgi:hypothetical protein